MILRLLPDNLVFDFAPGESVLDAARRASLPITHAGGGKAKMFDQPLDRR
jgi:hypothetical protein